ncbi:MAG TPA: hypothetical protein VGI29_14745, partial [Candidatus Binataceae bacterium]
GAITVGGSATVNSACGLYDNSTSSSALTVSGGGTITAPLVGVAGGTSINGGGSSPPSTGIAQFGDPLAYIAAPDIGSNPCSGGYHTQNISGPITAPQTYCGGIHINAGNTVSFGSGLYVIDGGGITIDGGATVSGSNVTFYLTGGNGNGSNASNYSGVTINSTATVNLSAPCTASGGDIAGMLFFQDRSITNGHATSINGSASSTFSGAIYFPTTPLAYAGSTGANMFTLLVSDTMSFLGNSTVGNNFSCLANGSLIKDAALVQ